MHIYKAPKKVVTAVQLKLSKGEKRGWMTRGFNLSPSTESIKAGGINMCLWAGTCKKFCLKKSGMNQMSTHEISRINKTLLWLRDPALFMSKDEKEIGALIR